MAARPTILLAPLSCLLGLIVSFAVPTLAIAQEQHVPDVENARHSFEGVVNANAVYVRSGPSENFYPTMKLDKGTPVMVVGIKYNWLKIEPPEGSFSYVAKAYVQRHGDGSEGVVADNASPNVRAGTELNPMKTTVQTKLQPGQRVKILGEEDEYFKIEPPAGAYLYVDQRYVDAVRRKPRAGEEYVEKPDSDASNPDAPEADPDTTEPVVTETPDEPDTDPSTRPDDDTESARGGPTTAESASPAVTAKIEDLEAKFKEASAQPLVDQPLESLASGYQSLSAKKDLPRNVRRVVDARLVALKVRTEARESYLNLKKNEAENQEHRQALVSEREELQERLKQTEVKVFTAVGALRTSSLQTSAETLYRLTDPETGRTVVYIRSTDPNFGSLINQFVGVRGELTNDPQLNLKVISNPTGVEAVDQTKVNGTVAAQVIPPSLLPKIPTASTSDAEQSAVEPQ